LNNQCKGWEGKSNGDLVIILEMRKRDAVGRATYNCFLYKAEYQLRVNGAGRLCHRHDETHRLKCVCLNTTTLLTFSVFLLRKVTTLGHSGQI
jgi:hypothetical protein